MAAEVLAAEVAVDAAPEGETAVVVTGTVNLPRATPTRVRVGARKTAATVHSNRVPGTEDERAVPSL